MPTNFTCPIDDILPKMKTGNGKVGRIEIRRHEQGRKYSKMDKGTKDKPVRSPGENQGG